MICCGMLRFISSICPYGNRKPCCSRRVSTNSNRAMGSRIIRTSPSTDSNCFCISSLCSITYSYSCFTTSSRSITKGSAIVACCIGGMTNRCGLNTRCIRKCPIGRRSIASSCSTITYGCCMRTRSQCFITNANRTITGSTKPFIFRLVDCYTNRNSTVTCRIRIGSHCHPIISTRYSIRTYYSSIHIRCLCFCTNGQCICMCCRCI